MQVGRKYCTSCGSPQEAPAEHGRADDGRCRTCGVLLEADALTEFASRLARFGLGATRRPLLGRFPELPDAK